MSVLQILEQLSHRSGSLDKLDILEANRSNEVLKRFFYLALDPMVTFGIKKIPSYVRDPKPKYSLQQAMDDIGVLISRELTGNAAIGHLSFLLGRLEDDDAEVISRIIEKDPKCGVAGSTVNKVWKGLIFDFPVMKASPHDEGSFDRISWPAFSQLKLDGARLAIVVDKTGKVTALSSSGREITTHGVFDWMGEFPGFVFDGELMMTDGTGNFMERKAGNGIVNRAVKGTIPVEQAQGLHCVVFDMIPLAKWQAGKHTTPYSDRYRDLCNALTGAGKNVSIVETQMVNSEEEAVAHFRTMLDRGLEGTIVKDKDSIWEGKRRKDHIKLKGIISCDVLVVGVEEGTGKNKGKIGALVYESADGLVKGNVGTGLSDKDREKDPSEYIGKIIEIGYNERIKNKAEGSTWSLFLPRFFQVRLDKTVADTIENIPMKA
ncbi:MAG: ATP-dependent DNA ligase [Desulfuromonadaceae bacterium]